MAGSVACARLWLFALLALALLPFSAGAMPDLREAVADPVLGDLVRPTEDESRWLAINWQTDLWEARRLAVAQGKPIFLWQMDGHPLGCV